MVNTAKNFVIRKYIKRKNINKELKLSYNLRLFKSKTSVHSFTLDFLISKNNLSYFRLNYKYLFYLWLNELSKLN